MPKILLVQNETREEAGSLRHILLERKIAFEQVDLSKGQQYPDPRSYSAIIVFGGPDSANDDTEKMEMELARNKEAVDAGVPFLGICLGLQSLVKSAGGEVVRNPVKEIGIKDAEGRYYEIELTEEGKKDPLFRGCGSTMRVFHLHGETVVPTHGMRLLAIGKHCVNQVVKVGSRAYGIQGHFELDDEMFEEWVRNDPDLRKIDSPQFRSEYEKVKGEYLANCNKIFGNFLSIAGLK
ncbi:MAG: type 1 glutamine amidotransferase [Candidatus Diapherotrites archaeon]|uniref:Type 1 glutamine amidotransferase n=1 Tax=Candidatus Iainarchaeum sp. TaxID=3101447 RepID=A0A8T3YJI8_9ARCH|nr:type 1 glutamine amidotransferase [Candidatus Diapherotrites archaeon]